MHGDSEDQAGRSPEAKSERAVEQLDELLSSPDFIEALESEHFKTFLDQLPIAIVVAKQIRSQERIIYGNLALGSLIGLDLMGIKGKTWSILDNYRLDDTRQTPLGQAILNGDEFLGIFRRETSDKDLALIEAYVTTVSSTDNPENFRLAVLVDVTERELSYREEFHRQARDKDMLLKELQHRVRNDLQIITALVRLEARNARDDKTSNFESIASRIHTLSILYSGLSSDAKGQRIDLGEYLSGIASANMHSHAREGIRLDLQVESCPVSINVAMPTGLVVNEAMTNAFKHAFVGRESGTITLHCLRQGDSCSVLIADDGIGLSADGAWPSNGTISALIVQSLQANARTTAKVESEPGKGTSISFVVPTLPVDTLGSKTSPREATLAK
jgi:two-component sensor histidine kinase